METWDERYASGRYGAAAEPHGLLVKLAKNLKPGKALDLACGAGRNANFLAAQGWRVTAVDNSRVGLEIARQKAAETAATVDYRLADLEAGEFEIEAGAYDLICDFYYLQPDLFPKMKAGVKTGGLVIAAIHIFGAGEQEGRFLLREGELKEFFRDFEILHYHETPQTDADAAEHHRRTAEIIARRRK
jgi:tellurite methyltransferase